MPRKLRIEYAGACYHIINRGNYRQSIFAGEGAAEAFERCLAETCERCGWRVHAFVIMRNHFHLAVETPQANLSAGMKHLQGTWANRFNRYRGLQGRPFQGRFKALHVEAGHALAQVAHYIHLNPAKARVIAAERSAQFRWSSLWWFPQKKRPAWLVAETVLAEAGNLADTAAGWRRYGDYLAWLGATSVREREEKFGRLSRGWAVGTQTFRQNLLADLQAQGADVEHAARPGESEGDRRTIRDEVWSASLATAATAAGLALDQLGGRKSDPDKVLLAAVLKASTDVSNGWLSARLQMGAPASASQFVRRFHLREGPVDPRFLRAKAAVEQARAGGA
jgi:REP element-mobilizing transposase RayT